MIAALLGLDIGTTSTKAVLFDLEGRELARENSAPYHVYTPNPGWVEQDPEEIWQAVLAAIGSVMAKVSADKVQSYPTQRINVLALCMAAQSGSLLPVNDKGEPLYPLITWMDGRTAGLVRQWQKEGLQKKVKEISGWSLYPGLCLPTIAWLRRHMPDVFAATKTYFSLNDFIAYRLTGLRCTNPSNGGGMQFVNIHNGRWSETLCSMAGITPVQLSPIQPAGAIIGNLTPDVCHATGLSSETMLINGGHDQGCTALGLGVISPGKLLLACGTAWVITGVTTVPDMDKIPSNLDINAHTAPGRWTVSQSLGGLGASLEWWGNQAWKGTRKDVSREGVFIALNEELAKTEAGAGGLYFLPLTGGHSGPATTRRGGFIGLQLSHTRADMARAILESAAFELKWALENINSAGLPMNRFWMVGGAANSPLWPAILAAATAIPISLPQYDNWPALGAAILAGLGAGVFDSIEQGLLQFQKPASDTIVDEALSSLYEKSFTQYKEHVWNNL